MGHAKSVMLASAFLLIFASGCATTAPFYYSYPEEAPQFPSDFVLSLAPVRDARVDKSLDGVYSALQTTVTTVDQILEREMRSIGLFANLSGVGAGEGQAESAAGSPRARLALKGELHELSWEVPGYDGMMATAFVVGFLTGGIGVIIYGSTPTDVYGKAIVEFELADEATGAVLLKERYVGSHEERMSKLSCDVPKTKSRMAGEALADAMAQLKADLGKVVRETERSPVASPMP